MSSLTNGNRMFDGCKLNTASIKNIAETINDVRDLTENWNDIYKTIKIGIGNSTPTEEEHTYLTQIHNKGWEVYVNGSAYTPASPAAITTLDETGETMTTPIPYLG